MLKNLIARILQLINPQLHISANIKGIDIKNILPEVSTDTPMPTVKQPKKTPRLGFTDDEGSWTTDSIANEIKIDLTGKIYFKINRTWIEQTAVKSVRFYG